MSLQSNNLTIENQEGDSMRLNNGTHTEFSIVRHIHFIKIEFISFATTKSPNGNKHLIAKAIHVSELWLAS